MQPRSWPWDRQAEAGRALGWGCSANLVLLTTTTERDTNGHPAGKALERCLASWAGATQAALRGRQAGAVLPRPGRPSGCPCPVLPYLLVPSALC